MRLTPGATISDRRLKRSAIPIVVLRVVHADDERERRVEIGDEREHEGRGRPSSPDTARRTRRPDRFPASGRAAPAARRTAAATPAGRASGVSTLSCVSTNDRSHHGAIQREQGREREVPLTVHRHGRRKVEPATPTASRRRQDQPARAVPRIESGCRGRPSTAPSPARAETRPRPPRRAGSARPTRRGQAGRSGGPRSSRQARRPARTPSTRDAARRATRRATGEGRGSTRRPGRRAARARRDRTPSQNTRALGFLAEHHERAAGRPAAPPTRWCWRLVRGRSSLGGVGHAGTAGAVVSGA